MFRRVHAECFGALDCYYTPFLPPPWLETALAARRLKIDPHNSTGLNVVPQLMSKNTDEFVWAAQGARRHWLSRGQSQLGCPSGNGCRQEARSSTGFLSNLDELEVFLRVTCANVRRCRCR